MSGAIAVIAPTDAKRMWSGGPLRLCSSIRKGRGGFRSRTVVSAARIFAMAVRGLSLAFIA